MFDSGVNNVEDCLVWAFGEDYNRLDQSELDDIWNQRHGDSFTIEGSDCVIESTKKIAKVFLWYSPETVFTISSTEKGIKIIE